MLEQIPLPSTPQSRLFIGLLSLLMVVFVGVIDFGTGPEFGVSILYLLPIASASWFISRRAGLIFAALCTTTWCLADHFGGRLYSTPWIPSWNALVLMSVLAIFSYLVAKVRCHLELEAMRARRDFLTALPNHQFFFELAAEEMKLASGFYPLTLAYIKIDGLKWINQRFGIAVGDQLVCAIAQTIKENVPRQDLVGRLGGTLFGVLLPDTSSDAANLILEKTQNGLANHRRRYNQPMTFFISAVTYTKSPLSVAELMHEAERRLGHVSDSKRDTLKIEVVETSQPLN